MRVFHILFTCIAVFLASAGVQAQQAAPALRDYAVRNPQVSFAEDNLSFTLSFNIINQGGDAVTDSVINVFDLSADGELVNSRVLPPLQAGQSVDVGMPFITRNFEPGSTIRLRIEAGIDLYELAGTALASNNATEITVTIPNGSSSGLQTPVPDAEGSSQANIDQQPFIAIESGGLRIGDTFISQDNLLLGLAITAGVLLVLWLLSVVLRLVFRRTPGFGRWQPAYATTMPMDPDSIAGRRQAWQLHAQNGSLLARCTDGVIHPLKILTSVDGRRLGNWKLVAMRLNQYDSYGRVARSEALAPKGLLKGINRIINRSEPLPEDKLERRMRPIARRLVRNYRKGISKRSAFLPVAMDLRFTGRHGEVRILFELYQCSGGTWQRLDQWEPEMSVIGRSIDEQLTYTIHGQSGGETMREYLTRLQDDVTWLLVEMLREPQPAEAPRTGSSVVPDTLTGMTPVSGS